MVVRHLTVNNFPRAYASMLASVHIGIQPMNLYERDGELHIAYEYAPEMPEHIRPLIYIPSFNGIPSPAREGFFGEIGARKIAIPTERAHARQTISRMKELQLHVDTTSARVELMTDGEIADEQQYLESRAQLSTDDYKRLNEFATAGIMQSRLGTNNEEAARLFISAAEVTSNTDIAAMLTELAYAVYGRTEADAAAYDLVTIEAWNRTLEAPSWLDPLRIFQGISACLHTADLKPMAEPFFTRSAEIHRARGDEYRAGTDMLRSAWYLINADMKRDVQDHADDWIRGAFMIRNVARAWDERAMKKKLVDKLEAVHLMAEDIIRKDIFVSKGRANTMREKIAREGLFENEEINRYAWNLIKDVK